MKGNLLAGRVLVGFIAVYHVLSGVLLMASGELSIQAAKALAGFTVKGSPELGILGEITACYLIAFGVMMGLAAWDPIKNRAILTGGVVLFFLRLVQRAVFSGKVIEVFQVPPGRYWFAFGLVALLALGLLLFRLQVRKAMA